MGIPSIENIRNIGHFATLYQWSMSVIQFPSGASLGLSSEDMNVRCVSATMPVMTGQSIDVNIRGHHIRQHGIYDSSHTLDLMFIEAVDNKITNALYQWRKACWEVETGVQKTKQEVEATIMLERLDNQHSPLWKYTLFGCFLEAYDPGGQLGEATSDAVRPSMTLSYDYFKEE